MQPASVDETARHGPSLANWIIQLGACQLVAGTIPAACDKHHSVGQQRCRVPMACGAEAAGDCPGPADRIVEFRARVVAAIAAHDEYLAIAQQRRGVTEACNVQVAGGGPSSSCRVVELRG